MKKAITCNEEYMRLLNGVKRANIIERSTVPEDALIRKCIHDYFIIWKQKELIGGDFYWFEQFDDKYLIAIIDCTGHGIPGALMSMIGKANLSNLFENEIIDDPSKILKKLNLITRKILKQNTLIDPTQYVDNNDLHMLNDDGMVIGVCLVKPNEKEIVYSSSKIKLYICNETGVSVKRGSKHGVGYRKTLESFEYKNQVIPIKDNDMYYIMSDGFIDQRGMIDNKAFSEKSFKELISKIYSFPMEEQKKILLERFEIHKGDTPQTDDIIVFGFKP